MDRKNGPRITVPIDFDHDGKADFYVSSSMADADLSFLLPYLVGIAFIVGVMFAIWWLFVETAVGWWLLLIGVCSIFFYLTVYTLQVRAEAKRWVEEQQLRSRYGGWLPGPDIIAQDLLDEQARKIAKNERQIEEQDRRIHDWPANEPENQSQGFKGQTQHDLPAESVERQQHNPVPKRPKRDLSKYIKFNCTDCGTSYMALRKPKEREVVCKKCGMILILPAQID